MSYQQSVDASDVLLQAWNQEARTAIAAQGGAATNVFYMEAPEDAQSASYIIISDPQEVTAPASKGTGRTRLATSTMLVADCWSTDARTAKLIARELREQVTDGTFAVTGYSIIEVAFDSLRAIQDQSVGLTPYHGYKLTATIYVRKNA